MLESLEGPRQLTATRRESTRELDTAVGILVGWRRSSTHAAFRELVTVSDRHGVPIFALASALVSLAGRDTDGHSAGEAARRAAELEWGLNQLL